MEHLSNIWVWSGVLLSLLGQVNNDEWPLEACSLMQRDQVHANHVGSKISCTEKKETSFRVSLPFLHDQSTSYTVYCSTETYIRYSSRHNYWRPL